MRENQLLDSVPLQLAASEAQLRKEEGETGLTSHEHFEAWTAGKEEGAVTTALRATRLAANESAVLVYQAGGFEHVKRRYDLFVVEGEKLKRVWSFEEGQGPVWSSVEVAAGATRDEIIYFNAVPAQGSAPDQFKVERLTWNAASKSLEAQPITELPAVVAGEFATAEAARRVASGSCLSSYWVLPGDVVARKSSRFVLATVTANKEMAEAELGRTCDTKSARQMAVFHPK
jgi:hypothetical protein